MIQESYYYTKIQLLYTNPILRASPSAAGPCWLLIIDWWLLIIEYWLLIIDYWLSIIDYWLLIIDYWVLIVDYWLLIIDYWLSIIDYWLSIIDYWLLMNYCQIEAVGWVTGRTGRTGKTGRTGRTCGIILGVFWSHFGYLLEWFRVPFRVILVFGAPFGCQRCSGGARSGFFIDFVIFLVSLGGLWGALGVLWEASGSLWVPKWRPGVTKEGTEDLQERFCGHLKNHCFTKGKHGFWRSGSPKELKKWPWGLHLGGFWWPWGAFWWFGKVLRGWNFNGF